MKAKSGKLIHHPRRETKDEWYTPPDILTAARDVLGTIDLDPASSEIANLTVQATRYYTIERDGLAQTWYGNVWLNPPYSRPACYQFCHKVAEAFGAGEITAAIVLVNNATETGYFQRLLDVASGVCFPAQRVKFLDPEGRPSNRSLQGQALVYLGPETSRFAEIFREFGAVVSVERRTSKLPRLHRLFASRRIDQGRIHLRVRDLLEAGADPNARDEKGNTPLHAACIQGITSEVIPVLLRYGAADLEARNDAGNTPLHEACSVGHTAAVRVLLERGAKVNARRRDDGGVAIHDACIYGHTDIVRLLLEHGADVNAKNEWGAAAIHAVCTAREVDLVRLLLSHGAEMEARTDADITPLHWACQYGRTAIARFLIEHGADVNARDEAGRTPLDLAMDLKTDNLDREEILDLLREYAPEQVMEAYCKQQA